MWLQKGKTKSLNAGAFMAGFVKIIQASLGVTMIAAAREIFAEIHSAIKTRILFFYPFIVVYSPEEENRQ